MDKLLSIIFLTIFSTNIFPDVINRTNFEYLNKQEYVNHDFGLKLSLPNSWEFEKTTAGEVIQSLEKLTVDTNQIINRVSYVLSESISAYPIDENKQVNGATGIVIMYMPLSIPIETYAKKLEISLKELKINLKVDNFITSYSLNGIIVYKIKGTLTSPNGITIHTVYYLKKINNILMHIQASDNENEFTYIEDMIHTIY